MMAHTSIHADIVMFWGIACWYEHVSHPPPGQFYDIIFILNATFSPDCLMLLWPKVKDSVHHLIKLVYSHWIAWGH